MDIFCKDTFFFLFAEEINPFVENNCTNSCLFLILYIRVFSSYANAIRKLFEIKESCTLIVFCDGRGAEVCMTTTLLLFFSFCNVCS